MEKELNKLVSEYEEKNKYFDLSYYTSDFTSFKKLYIKKLVKSLFKKKNAKYFVEHMDIVMKYTNQYNIEWLKYDVLFNTPGFIESFIDNLKYFPFKDNIDDLIDMLCTHNKCKLKIEELFNEKMINNLLDFNLKSNTYSHIYIRMPKKSKLLFLKESIKKQVSIDFRTFDLEKDEMKIIDDNILTIANYSNNLLALKNYTEDESKIKIINEIINARKDSIITEIINDKFHKLNNNDSFKELLELILMDIIKNENTTLSDIKIKQGAYSTVIIIKDKVLKIGRERGTKTFANNPYIVKPLLRKSFKIGKDKIFIEATERVDTSTLVSDEELYQLYKKLRRIGLIWTDVAPKNVGRLIKSNDIHWNGNLTPTDKILELENYRGNEVLKEGDLVVLDADFIFDENDEIKTISNTEHLRKIFENRYQLGKIGNVYQQDNTPHTVKDIKTR